MIQKEIMDFLGSDWVSVKDLISKSLHTDVKLLGTINDSIMSKSGKLLRPLIALLISKAIGDVNTDSIKFAAASELLHNATLMHDDVADNSAERRGMPTIATLLNPTAAVLIGDFWLAKAVELVMSSTQYTRVSKMYSHSLSDLAEGEMLQLEKSSNADTSEEEYYKIILCKTASLFATVGAAAADSVGATDEQFKSACDFAQAFGMAFQIKDDILDYAGSDILGKPIGSDIKERKITLPLLGAMKNSGREAEIREMIKNIDKHQEYCSRIKDFVLENGGVKYATDKLDNFIDSAIKSLSAFPESQAKDYLIEIARYNVFRQI